MRIRRLLRWTAIPVDVTKEKFLVPKESVLGKPSAGPTAVAPMLLGDQCAQPAPLHSPADASPCVSELTTLIFLTDLVITG